MCKTKNARLPNQLEGEGGVKQGLKIAVILKESRCNDVTSVGATFYRAYCKLILKGLTDLKIVWWV